MLTTTIVGTCIVPLIYLFNSYFIGRFLKRLYPQFNGYMLTGIGFFVLLGIIFILTLPVYVLPVNFLGYIILLAIMQGILIVAYLINWRYSFARERFDWLIFIFSTVLIVTMVGTWFLSNRLSFIINPSTSETDQYNSLMNYFNKLIGPSQLNVSTWLTSEVWDPTQDIASGQYVAWNAINLTWISIFNVGLTNLGPDLSSVNAVFTNYSMLIIYSIITSLIISGVFAPKIISRDYKRMTSIFAIVLLINAPMFLLTKTPLNGSAWIIPLSVLLIRLTFDSVAQNATYRLDFLCAIILVSAHTMSVAFILFNFTIVIVKIIMSFLNRVQHVTSSSLIFSFGLMFPSALLIQSVSDLGSFIFILLLILLYIIWFIAIRNSTFKSKIVIYEQWMQRQISWFVVTLILAIYAVSILLMFTGGTFYFASYPWIILPNPFISILAPATFNQTLQIILNVSFWGINIGIFIFYFSSALLSKFSIYTKFINSISFKKRLALKKQGNSISSELQTNGNTVVLTETHSQTVLISDQQDLSKPANLYLQKGTQENYYALFSLLVILLIWNPLSTNLINRITSSANFDLSWIFFLAIVPSFFNYSLPRSKVGTTCLISFMFIIVIALNVALGLGNYLFN